MDTETEKLVLSKLTEVETPGKYDDKRCRAIVDLWNEFSSITPETFSNYSIVFTRLVRVVSRTILGGLWAKLRESSNERLRESISKVQTYVEKVSVQDGKTHCEAISSLLDCGSPWTKQSVKNVLNPDGDIQSLEKIDVLFAEEGWILFQSRLEMLTGLSEPLLAAFSEACVLKAHSQSQATVIKENFSSFNDLPLETYFEVLTMYSLLIAKQWQLPDKEHVRQKLKSFLTPPRNLTAVIERLIQAESTSRLQPAWKGWKGCEGYALAVVEMAMHNANDTQTEESQLKFVFRLWLSICRRLKQRADGRSLPLEVTVELSEIPEEEIEKLLPSILKCLAMNAFQNDYAYKYGDWIVEIFGLNKTTRAKCVELYLTRLTPEVSIFMSLHDRDEEKETCQKLSESLGIAFSSLSQYFNDFPQVSFEIRLTAFSLNSTLEGLNAIRELTNSPDTGVDLRTKFSRSHNAGLDLPTALFLDLIHVVAGARVNRLTCCRESTEMFVKMCERHLATKGNDIRRRSQLELVKPTDFSLYEGLEPAFDEDDTGYEAGYLPNEEDLQDLLLEAETGQPRNRIREPKSRMSKVYRENAALRKRQEAALNGIELPKSKKRRIKGEDETIENGIKPVKRKYIRKKDPTKPIKPKRTYVRKLGIGIKKEYKPNTTFNALLLDKLPFRTPVVKLVNLKEQILTAEDIEQGKGVNRKRTSRFLKSTSKMSSAMDIIPKRRRAAIQRSYKTNDISVNCVQTNQLICLNEGKSGIWPSSRAAKTIEGHYSFFECLPSFPEVGPKPEGTTMSYHTSSSVSYFVRSFLKPLNQGSISTMAKKYNALSDRVLENDFPQSTPAYSASPLAWRNYFGEKLEQEVNINAQSEMFETPRVDEISPKLSDWKLDGITELPINESPAIFKVEPTAQEPLSSLDISSTFGGGKGPMTTELTLETEIGTNSIAATENANSNGSISEILEDFILDKVLPSALIDVEKFAAELHKDWNDPKSPKNFMILGEQTLNEIETLSVSVATNSQCESQPLKVTKPSNDIGDNSPSVKTTDVSNNTSSAFESEIVTATSHSVEETRNDTTEHLSDASILETIVVTGVGNTKEDTHSITMEESKVSPTLFNETSILIKLLSAKEELCSVSNAQTDVHSKVLTANTFSAEKNGLCQANHPNEENSPKLEELKVSENVVAVHFSGDGYSDAANLISPTVNTVGEIKVDDSEVKPKQGDSNGCLPESFVRLSPIRPEEVHGSQSQIVTNGKVKMNCREKTNSRKKKRPARFSTEYSASSSVSTNSPFSIVEGAYSPTTSRSSTSTPISGANISNTSVILKDLCIRLTQLKPEELGQARNHATSLLKSTRKTNKKKSKKQIPAPIGAKSKARSKPCTKFEYVEYEDDFEDFSSDNGDGSALSEYVPSGDDYSSSEECRKRIPTPKKVIERRKSEPWENPVGTTKVSFQPQRQSLPSVVYYICPSEDEDQVETIDLVSSEDETETGCNQLALMLPDVSIEKSGFSDGGEQAKENGCSSSESSNEIELEQSVCSANGEVIYVPWTGAKTGRKQIFPIVSTAPSIVIEEVISKTEDTELLAPTPIKKRSDSSSIYVSVQPTSILNRTVASATSWTPQSSRSKVTSLPHALLPDVTHPTEVTIADIISKTINYKFASNDEIEILRVSSYEDQRTGTLFSQVMEEIQSKDDHLDVDSDSVCGANSLEELLIPEEPVSHLKEKTTELADSPNETYGEEILSDLTDEAIHSVNSPTGTEDVSPLNREEACAAENSKSTLTENRENLSELNSVAPCSAEHPAHVEEDIRLDLSSTGDASYSKRTSNGAEGEEILSESNDENSSSTSNAVGGEEILSDLNLESSYPDGEEILSDLNREAEVIHLINSPSVTVQQSLLLNCEKPSSNESSKPSSGKEMLESNGDVLFSAKYQHGVPEENIRLDLSGDGPFSNKNSNAADGKEMLSLNGLNAFSNETLNSVNEEILSDLNLENSNSDQTSNVTDDETTLSNLNSENSYLSLSTTPNAVDGGEIVSDLNFENSHPCTTPTSDEGETVMEMNYKNITPKLPPVTGESDIFPKLSGKSSKGSDDIILLLNCESQYPSKTTHTNRGDEIRTEHTNRGDEIRTDLTYRNQCSTSNDSPNAANSRNNFPDLIGETLRPRKLTNEPEDEILSDLNFENTRVTRIPNAADEAVFLGLNCEARNQTEANAAAGGDTRSDWNREASFLQLTANIPKDSILSDLYSENSNSVTLPVATDEDEIVLALVTPGAEKTKAEDVHVFPDLNGCVNRYGLDGSKAGTLGLEVEEIITELIRRINPERNYQEVEDTREYVPGLKTSVELKTDSSVSTVHNSNADGINEEPDEDEMPLNADIIDKEKGKLIQPDIRQPRRRITRCHLILPETFEANGQKNPDATSVATRIASNARICVVKLLVKDVPLEAEFTVEEQSRSVSVSKTKKGKVKRLRNRKRKLKSEHDLTTMPKLSRFDSNEDTIMLYSEETDGDLPPSLLPFYSPSW